MNKEFEDLTLDINEAKNYFDKINTTKKTFYDFLKQEYSFNELADHLLFEVDAIFTIKDLKDFITKNK